MATITANQPVKTEISGPAAAGGEKGIWTVCSSCGTEFADAVQEQDLCRRCGRILEPEKRWHERQR